jgi:hypothetical protein
MNEQGVWNTLKRGMATSGWHATRVESSSGNGYPDLSVGLPRVSGFIELKYREEWPKRQSTKVKLELRPEQKLWFRERGNLSGNVWAFVRISDHFFLVDWRQSLVAAEEGWTFGEWVELSNGCWNKRVNFIELYELLKGGC